MHQYIAFLRAMNLGRRRVKMDYLRSLFEQLRFSDVATFIASGNVLFASSSSSQQPAHSFPAKRTSMISSFGTANCIGNAASGSRSQPSGVHQRSSRCHCHRVQCET
ncbi:MAG: DUF1697 domain-containing protein [Verrucomicrobia bacterium]|nr:DUF1697 domain-containing protein [Verrucomicrobiota bacterium]